MMAQHFDGYGLNKLAIATLCFENEAHSALAEQGSSFITPETLANARHSGTFGVNCACQESFCPEVGLQERQEFLSGFRNSTRITEELRTLFRR